MTYRCCPSCHKWYPKKDGACSCGEPPAEFNKYLRTALLNNHLYNAVEQAQPKTQYETLRKGFKRDLDVIAKA